MKRMVLTLILSLAGLWGFAQDYHHYLIHWNLAGQDYLGVMAVNTRLPRQVLRLAYFDGNSGHYRLIEQRYQLSTRGGGYYLRNVGLVDKTFCRDAPAVYFPDSFFFTESGFDIQMWCIDSAGNRAAVDDTFIPLGQIDGYKPFFWPERYGACGSRAWFSLIGEL